MISCAGEDARTTAGQEPGRYCTLLYSWPVRSTPSNVAADPIKNPLAPRT